MSFQIQTLTYSSRPPPPSHLTLQLYLFQEHDLLGGVKMLYFGYFHLWESQIIPYT